MSTLNLIIQTSTLERLLFLVFGILVKYDYYSFLYLMAFKWQGGKTSDYCYIGREGEISKLHAKNIVAIYRLWPV